MPRREAVRRLLRRQDRDHRYGDGPTAGNLASMRFAQRSTREWTPNLVIDVPRRFKKACWSTGRPAISAEISAAVCGQRGHNRTLLPLPSNLTNALPLLSLVRRERSRHRSNYRPAPIQPFLGNPQSNSQNREVRPVRAFPSRFSSSRASTWAKPTSKRPSCDKLHRQGH